MLAASYGPKLAFLIVGGCQLSAALLYRLVPESRPRALADLYRPTASSPGAPPENPPVTERDAPAPRGPDEERRRGRNPVDPGSLLRANASLQAALTMHLGLFSGYAALLAVLPLHAQLAFGASPSQLGLMFSLTAALGLVGAPLGGWLADRLGRKAVITPSGVLVAVGACGAALAGDAAALVPALVCWGLGNSLLVPGLSAFVVDVTHLQERARAQALCRSGGDAAFLVAPLALGWVADLWGTTMALTGAASVAAIATLVFAIKAKTSI